MSSKLNFPTNHAIYKDLPELDESYVASQMIRKTVTKTQESKKFHELRGEVNELINQLVELEYKNEELNKKNRLLHLPMEDEFLGLNVFNELPQQVPNVKTETQRFYEATQKDLYQNLFQSDNYLSNRIKHDFSTRKETDKIIDKTCNCLQDFYTQHASCS